MAGVLPMALLAFAIVRSDHEQILGIDSFVFGALIIAAGFVVFGVLERGRTITTRARTALTLGENKSALEDCHHERSEGSAFRELGRLPPSEAGSRDANWANAGPEGPLYR